MSCTKIIGEMKLEGFDTMHTSKIKNYLYPQIQKKKLLPLRNGIFHISQIKISLGNINLIV